MATPPRAGHEPYDALLERIKSGDGTAVGELVQRAQDIARRYSLTICGNAPDRDDAVQEALLSTFRHASTIRDPGAFRPWLYRTVKNACLLGRTRGAAGMPTVPIDDRDGSGAPLQANGLAPESGVDLRRAVASLPPDYREVVFLRDLEGLSTREVSDVLGLSEPNVKVRLHRAHARLRAVLAGATPARATTRGGRRAPSRRRRSP
jgi:RNA polymerase sigma-70 factor (ECF subfamily)